MIQAGLGNLEGGGHIEDLLPVLNGDDAPRGEMLAVPGPVDLVDDRQN